MVECDKTNFGCNGGNLATEWKFLENKGIVSDTCLPYVSGDGKSRSCATSCADGSAKVYYSCESGSTVKATKPDEIKSEILANGPVETGFTVYADFMNYESGIYTHVSGRMEGGHAVKIIGWGVENGVKYWTVANSWNTTWGEKGFFRIKEGECGIDEAVYACTPNLKSPAAMFF